MYHLQHDIQSPGAATSHKSFSSIAYRRGSVPQINSYSSPPTVSLPGSAYRTPLAPLDPQAAQGSHSAIDDQMSSSPLLGYVPLERAQDRGRERVGDSLRYSTGPLTAANCGGTDGTGGFSPARRKSITNHSQPGISMLRLSSHTGRSISRRASHTTFSSTSTIRRPSLPTVFVHSSSPTGQSFPKSESVFALDSHANATAGSGGDDLYSNLSSYTFGSAQPMHSEYLEMISPFSIPGSSSAERTPRPSVSGPSSGNSHMSHRTRSRTPRIRASDIDIEDQASCAHDADDEDEDEAERQTRSKMRAMNDGTRRPSLPMHPYPSGQPKSSSFSSSAPQPNTSSTSSEQSSPSASDAQSMHSELDSEEGTSCGDGEEGDGGFDTEVEIDLQHSIIPAPHASDFSDGASQHTFGGHYDQYPGEAVLHPHDSTDATDGATYDGRTASSQTTNPQFTTAYSSYQERVENVDHPSDLSKSSMTSVADAGREREDSLATLMAPQGSQSLNDAWRTLKPLAALSQSEGGPGTHESRIEGVQLVPDVNMDSSLESQPQSGSNALAGFDLGYIFDHVNQRGHRASWQSAAPSWMQVASHDKPGSQHPSDGRLSGFDAFDFAGWGSPVTGAGGRRPSTVTVGSADDAFLRHVQRYDPVSTTRAVEWSFNRETADGSSPDSQMSALWIQNSNSSRILSPGVQQIWRHVHVGRFKVDKLTWKPDDPSKASSQRVNVRHIVDPYSKGNVLGGPNAIVHKHSRAIAFSIFRKYDLFGHRQRHGRSTMPTMGSILLATRKVQEQYTSTRSTNQLNSHGLLKDGHGRSHDHASSGGISSSDHRATDSRRDRSASRDPGDRLRGRKGKEKGKIADSVGVSGQSTADDIDSLQFAEHHSPSSTSGPSTSVSPTIIETTYASSMSASERTAAVRHSMDASKFGYLSPTSSSDRSSVAVDIMNMDYDDYEQRPPRTSHAEAFATLNQNSIEYFRGRTDPRSSDHESSHSRSITERLRRRLLGQNPVKVISRPTSGPPTAALEGHYTPPWITMAPRSHVEERDRVIQNLNESFKDVGLLPSFRTKGSSKNKRRNDEKVNIFSHVPTDSLYMILPLWPGETDAASTIPHGDPMKHSIAVEERQYLLVYYVPQAEHNDKRKKDDKKRSRSTSRATNTGSLSVNAKSILLKSFSVCARLISYQDLLGTGVRLPVDGLSITGPMSEAMATLPSAAVRESRLETPCAIIGVCSGRGKGVEFLPDGLAKVGLAVALPSLNPVERVTMPVEAEAEELNWKMTAIGRAAVEVAWLGCLAVAAFGPGPS